MVLQFKQVLRVSLVEAGMLAGSIIDHTVTDVTGDFSVTVSPTTDVRIVARAEMLQEASTGTAGWNVKVIDNTNQNAAL